MVGGWKDGLWKIETLLNTVLMCCVHARVVQPTEAVNQSVETQSPCLRPPVYSAQLKSRQESLLSHDQSWIWNKDLILFGPIKLLPRWDLEHLFCKQTYVQNERACCKLTKVSLSLKYIDKISENEKIVNIERKWILHSFKTVFETRESINGLIRR